MKILVIGGSYFLGRVFVMQAAAAGHDVTVLNRGTYSMADFGAKDWKADRHDSEAVKGLPAEDFDVVADFAAYRKGDIEGFLEAFGGTVKQYIFISTADVYEKWTNKPITEDSPLETRHFGGENGEYIWQKLLLEKELTESCKGRSIAATCVRPAILYGPFNYAPRESVYVQMACAGVPILCPVGAAGRFQPVYVRDAANLLLALCGKEKAYGRAYNLAGDTVDYETFLEALVTASGGRAKLSKVPADSKELSAPDAFLPFPLTKEETEFYDGSRILQETGISLIPLVEGLTKTWNVFSRLYQ